jgi:hypothetical protein
MLAVPFLGAGEERHVARGDVGVYLEFFVD